MSFDWDQLMYFKRGEDWGDPNRMDPDLLIRLDCFRHAVGFPFVLTTPAFKNGQGHNPNSYHYLGRAVDGRFVDPQTRKALSLREHVLIALRAPFTGIGIYTWSEAGTFLHFDNRFAQYERKLWLSEQPNQYQRLSPQNLKKLLQ